MQTFSFLIFLFFVGLRFEFTAVCLQISYSFAGATPPVHFVLVILEMWSLALLAFSHNPPNLSLPGTRITGVSHQHLTPRFLIKRKMNTWPGVHTCNPRTQEVEGGRWVPNSDILHSLFHLLLEMEFRIIS
jgi:hypothetical protein